MKKCEMMLDDERDCTKPAKLRTVTGDPICLDCAKGMEGEFVAPVAVVAELLHVVSEECAEVIKEIQKIHRFGVYDKEYDNAALLEKELGQLLNRMVLLADTGLVQREAILKHKEEDKPLLLKVWVK